MARKSPDFTRGHLISDPIVLLLNHAALGFKYSKLVIAMFMSWIWLLNELCVHWIIKERPIQLHKTKGQLQQKKFFY